MVHRTGATSCYASLRIIAWTRSGPETLAGLRFLSNFSIPGTVNCISSMDDTGCPSISGRGPLGSLVNCVVNCEFKAMTTSFGSLMSLSLDFRSHHSI